MKFYLIATTALCTIMPAMASAQVSPPSEAADDSSAGSNTEAEIIVTAQRREQRLQDAPVAVTALSSASLEQLNISDTTDLLTVVPNLQISPVQAGGGGTTTFFLRGMGQLMASNGSESAVGVYVDDFYYPSIQGSTFEVVDLDSVEVLRGPQGTLFGRNTIAGAIRYNSKKPTLGEFSGNIKGTVGTYDRYEATGAINLPVGDFAALRVSGGHLERGGFVKVQTGNRPKAGANQTDLVRAQALIEPTSRLRIDLTGQYSKDSNDGFAYNVPGPINVNAPFAQLYNRVATLTGQPLLTNAYVSSCYYCQYGTANREYSNTTGKTAQATVRYELSDQLSLKSLTSYQHIYTIFSSDPDSTPLRLFGGGTAKEVTRAFTQEGQLAGKIFDDRFDFVLGAYYLNQKNPDFPTIVDSFTVGRPSPVLQVNNRSLKSFAGYFDGSFALTDKLTLLGGYRYSVDDKKVLVNRVSDGALLTSRAETFKSSTYRAGLKYNWTPDIMTYVNVATGFRAGGFNPYEPAANPQLASFDPEKAITYEVGARMQFLDRRITINPTAFYTSWDKIQVQAFVPDLSGVIFRRLQNAGKARSYGFELEWSAAVSDAVKLFGTFSYLNLKYTDIGTASGITVNSKFQNAPPITFSMGASHTLRLASGGKIASSLNYSFQDDRASTNTDADTLILPAYGLVGGRIEYTAPGGKFSIGVFGTNLLDNKYQTGGTNFAFTLGPTRYTLGRPREFGVTGKFNF